MAQEWMQSFVFSKQVNQFLNESWKKRCNIFFKRQRICNKVKK